MTDYKSKITLKNYIDKLSSDLDFEIDVFDYKIIDKSGKTLIDSEENPFLVEENEITAYAFNKTIKISLNIEGTESETEDMFEWHDSSNRIHQIVFWN